MLKTQDFDIIKFSHFRKIDIFISSNLTFDTVVGDYIHTLKTTFDLNFDLYQAVKQHGYS